MILIIRTCFKTFLFIQNFLAVWIKMGRFSVKRGWHCCLFVCCFLFCFVLFFNPGVTLPACEVLCILFLTVHCIEEIQTVLIGLSMPSLSGWVPGTHFATVWPFIPVNKAGGFVLVYKWNKTVMSQATENSKQRGISIFITVYGSCHWPV